MLRDLDIRRALHQALQEEHLNEPDTLLVDELGLCQGLARVDLAVVNGSLNGFEIKSDADRLHRLARQRDAYGMVLDTVTLVTARRHLAEARAQLPSWWGLTVAAAANGKVTLHTVRRARPNRNVQPEAVARLLWREEALALLEAHGHAAGMRSKPRAQLWAALARELEPPVLAEGVRAALKRRVGWRLSSNAVT
jgi:hypothetical protein